MWVSRLLWPLLLGFLLSVLLEPVSLTLLSAAVFNHHGTLQLALCHYVITLLLNMIDIVHIVPLRSVSASSKVLGPDIFYHILSLSPRSLASSCLS